MNYIVTSPYYPQNFQNFTHRLHQAGVNVLGIGQEPYEQLNPELKASLTEYFRVDDMENLDEVTRAVAFFFHKYGPIDRLESHNEYWLEQDAALRTQFNIPGVKSHDLVKTKFKSEMKRHFQEAGVPVVPGLAVHSIQEAEAAKATLGLPLIAKPDNGVGAAATYKLLNEEDWRYFITHWDMTTVYFLEQFVNYDVVCTYDGLIDQNGDIVFETSLTYYYPPLDLVLKRLDNAFLIEREIDPLLRKYGQQMIKTFGMKERFFHIELFKTPDNDYIAIEYNNRPAGGFAVDVYNYGHQIDLYQWWADIVTQTNRPLQTPHGQYCLAIARRDEHAQHYIHTEDDIYARYGHAIHTKERIPVAFADLLGDTLYIITTKERHEVDEMVQFIGKRQV